VQPEIFVNFFLGELHIVYMGCRGHASFCVGNVTWFDLDTLAFILHFLNHFWIASGLVCSLRDAMSSSLSVASTTVSSALL
jgi:hypothetical protein